MALPRSTQTMTRFVDLLSSLFFFFNDTATTEIYTLSLHDALPICKVFSTQLPVSAIQSMEVVTGSVDAEFGDKTSLVANVTTRSGLGTGRPFGNLDLTYGSFGTVGGSVGIGFGSAKAGNFLAVEGIRSGRFLDTPEFTPFHDIGNNQTLFDHFDLEPNGKDSLHLNLFAARNWIQIPNDYDQFDR